MLQFETIKSVISRLNVTYELNIFIQKLTRLIHLSITLSSLYTDFLITKKLFVYELSYKYVNVYLLHKC